ncbi:MAG: hypothetical protein J6B36_08455 [Muribaculaceae bacterium]|nr:hypothetical protein [Muribaculaceae bacterium]
MARIKAAKEITAKYYEKGVQRKSRKAIWRRYVAPSIGVCYATFLAYLKMPLD